MSIRIISGSPTPGAAVTIGNFDGVHRGHQAVLAHLKSVAARVGAPTAVLTFEPLPREWFDGADAPPRIQSFDDKAAALRSYGVDAVVGIAFDDGLAGLDAHAFVDRVLVGLFAARAIVVGDDFRFGRERAGDLEMLHALGRERGFTAESAPTLEHGGERVSSTRVREALRRGDVAEAARLIGRPYAVSGEVVRGDALGRTMGVPTANLEPAHALALGHGVYAAVVALPDGTRHRGAAHYGRRGRIEVHVLDFDADLYGQRITVEFARFVRADAAFDDLEQLAAQMRRDIETIRHG